MKSVANVLRELEKNMAMISRDALLEKIDSDEEIEIIDFRGENAWKEARIKGSKQVGIQELPEKLATLLPNKNRTVICVCNGSIQSAMAVIFLRTEGYENALNLGGGFSGWMKNEMPIESDS